MLGFRATSIDATVQLDGPQIASQQSRFEAQTGAFGTAAGLFGTGMVDAPVFKSRPVSPRLSVPRLVVMLTIGIVLGALLFIATRTSNQTRPQIAAAPRAPVPAPAAAEPITVSVLSTEAAAAPVVEELPNLQVHIDAEPVTLAARRFLFTENSERSYGPEYQRGAFDKRDESTAKRLTREDLSRVKSSPGRYNADSSIEWQGGFRHSEPQKNAELGDAYLEYLNGAVGDGLGQKLSVIEGSPVRLLDKVAKTGRGPSGLRP